MGKTDSYMQTYANTDIHAEMLSDRVRTDTYRDAILKNPVLFEDKIVLDVGCGTGILSLFAAKAGARIVYSVEGSNMAPTAKAVAERNGLEDRVKILPGTMEDLELPEKVDVIISEWMGYFLLYERMLDSVLYARDKWLKPGGILLPNRSRLFLQLGEDFELEAKRFHFWDDVYGFDLSDVGTRCRSEPLVDFIEPSSVLSDAVCVLDLDMHTARPADQDFQAGFRLQADRDDTVHCIVGWFDVGFTKGKHVVGFSTGPDDERTHWKQTLFYLPTPIRVRKGDIIEGSIEVRQRKVNLRSLDVTIRLPELAQTAHYVV